MTWAERLEQKGVEKGLEKGREAGLLTGKRETLLRQLSAKFGALPKELRTRVEAIESVDAPDVLLERVLSATSLEDLKL